MSPVLEKLSEAIATESVADVTSTIVAYQALLEENVKVVTSPSDNDSIGEVVKKIGREASDLVATIEGLSKKNKSDTFVDIVQNIRSISENRGNTNLRDRIAKPLNSNFDELNQYLNSPEFFEYIKDYPQLLLGVYIFIDPFYIQSPDASRRPIVLWDTDAFVNEPIKPSFELPDLLSVDDATGNHLQPVNGEFKRFIQSINSAYRRDQPFDKQDYIKLFSEKAYAEKRNERDKKLGAIYIPSGEIDLCIFQMLAFGFAASNQGATPSLSDKVRWDCTVLTDREILLAFMRDTDRNDQLFVRTTNGQRTGERIEHVWLFSHLKRPFYQWLEEWGYLKELLPTEKMIACLEYLYFLLFPDDDDKRAHTSSKYLSLIRADGTNGKEYLEGCRNTRTVKRFKAEFEKYLKRLIYVFELKPNTYKEKRSELLSYEIDWILVINSFLGILHTWVKAETGTKSQIKLRNFESRTRIRPFIHFLNRNSHGYFSEGLVETTCRGVIYDPVLHMPEPFSGTGTKKNREYAGFFLCNLKDSDEKGFNYFNWRTTYSYHGQPRNQIYEYEPTRRFFEETLPEFLIIANELADIETEAVFFGGIISRAIEEQQRQSTRAAISQVMARNMSHNIGSHVLTRLKSKKDILSSSSELRYTGNQDARNLIQYDGWLHNRLHTIEDLENESQIAYFNEYLKNRMDLLADIATADPVMESPRRFYSEVFKGFDRNRILLNRISGLIDKDLKFRFELTDSRKGRPKKLDGDGDLLVSMTNDVLGDQAFYIILENIVRNICKHGEIGPTDKEKLTITIDIAENKDHPSFYEIRIFDNIERKSYPSGREDNINLPVKGSIEEIVISRNHAFNAELLDKTNYRVRPTGLGTIEMDVCAAYLRCLPIDASQAAFDSLFDLQFCGDNLAVKEEGHTHELGEVTNNHTRDQPMLMFAYKAPVLDENGVASKTPCGFPFYSLGYKLYIPKPKEILVTARDPTSFKIADFGQDALGYYGINVIDVRTLNRELDRGEVFKHQILYIHGPDAEIDNLLEKHCSALPKRVVRRLEPEALTSTEAFISRSWEQYAASQCLGKNNGVRFTNGDEGNTAEFISREGRVEALDNKYPISGTLTQVLIGNHDIDWCENVAACDNGNCRKCHVCLGGNCACRQKDYSPSYYYDMKCGHTRLDNDKVDDLIDRYPGTTQAVQRAQYLEVISTNVVVIDERIQASICGSTAKDRRKYNDNFEMYRYFKQQGIHIPTLKEANLNITDFGSFTHRNSAARKLREFLRKHLKRQTRGFYIFHLGIIEKLVDEGSGTGSKNSKAVYNVINLLFEGYESRMKDVVFTSGRGTPANLPIDSATKKKMFPFVPLSSIQNAIETQFDKYLLIKLLYNSRRTN